MIDIACGEGRFAAQLADYGHEVVGIDLSERRIQVAKQLENKHLQFFVHDMRFPSYINYFDYAFNFFTSFGYFAQARDHHMAANAFASGLKEGGILVIDYLNKTVVSKNLVPSEHIQRGGVDFYIERYLKAEHIIKKIKLTDREGQLHQYQESVRAFELHHFRELMEASGLQLIQHFGDYRLNPFQEQESPRLIMIFKKQRRS